jgi:hypothetical protein
MTGGTLTAKYFDTMYDAVAFCIYEAPPWSVHSIDKIEQ